MIKSIIVYLLLSSIFYQPQLYAQKVGSTVINHLQEYIDADTLYLKVQEGFFNRKGSYLLKVFGDKHYVLNTRTGVLAVFDTYGKTVLLIESSEYREFPDRIRIVNGSSMDFTVSNGRIIFLQNSNPSELELFELNGNHLKTILINNLDSTIYRYSRTGHGLFKKIEIAEEPYFIISLENSSNRSSVDQDPKFINGLLSQIDLNGSEKSRLFEIKNLPDLIKSSMSKSFKIDFHNNQFFLVQNSNENIYRFDIKGKYLDKKQGIRTSIRPYLNKQLLEDWLYDIKAFDNRLRYFHRVAGKVQSRSSVVDYFFDEQLITREYILEKDVVFATNHNDTSIVYLDYKTDTPRIIRINVD